MKKFILFIFTFLFYINTCFASAVTNMSLGEFVHKLDACLPVVTNQNIFVTNARYFSKLNGQDVYKINFNQNTSNMYACLKDNKIQQLLFINKKYDDTALQHSVIKVKASLVALGINSDSSSDTLERCIKKDDGRVYTFSLQENKLFLVAVDTNDKEINFHILGDD